jgi:hypothetical protein
VAEPEQLYPERGHGSPETIGEALGNLLADVGELIRSEIQLARTEVVGDLAVVGRASGYLIAGGAIAYLGVAFVLVAVMFALESLMSPWLAALIVGVVVLVVGGVLAWTGYKRLKSMNPLPERTIETLREDVEWLHNPKQ